MLRFRKLKTEDLPKTDWNAEPLSALLPDGAAYFEKTLQTGDTLFVIFDEGKPVGVLEMDREPVGEKPQCANVGLVMLLPEYRRHGLGRMLMVLAAGEAVERQLWFLSGIVPDNADAKAFAAAIHLKPSEWFADRYVLDLSDVEGLRHG